MCVKIIQNTQFLKVINQDEVNFQLFTFKNYSNL